jgi:NAD(P)-dependent dehydrogenase (short-subunit alcohol dehydrogenase family)
MISLADRFLDAMTGYVRSIAPRLWIEGIRVNAICPGVVATPLFNSGDGWDSIFDKEIFIEMKVVTGVVDKLLGGTDLVDGKGTLVRSDELYSRTLHISGDAFFFVEMPEFHDKKAPMTWKSMMGR